MRFVKGHTLSEAISAYYDKRARGKAEPLDLLALLNAFVSACHAVAYAHSRGVVHRDLKGANVVLGDFGEVSVLDWGLAKVVGRPEDRPGPAAVVLQEDLARAVTVQGQVLGTPAYMAPEQAAGHVHRIGPATDIYGLGAILYEILTGQPPFTGPDTDAVLRKVCDEDPLPPRQVCTGAPRALEAVCLRALAKQPEDRYASAEDLAREVQRWLADEPVSADREPWHARLGRWSRCHRTTVTTAAVALVLVLIGAVAGLFLWQAAEHRRRQQAEHYLVGLRQSAEEANAFALAELRAGRFASAATILRQAVESLGEEPSLESLREHLEVRRRRAHGLAEFYRLADKAERFAFLEYDEEARAASDGALAWVVAPEDLHWADNLPAEELTDPGQADPTRPLRQVQEDVYRALMLRAALQVGPVLLKAPNDPEVAAACRAALATVEQGHHFRPSFSGRLVEVFCRLRLGELKQPFPKLALEPTSAADYYFTGVAHAWLAHMPRDPLSRFVLAPAQALTDLDVHTPAETAQRLLRTAADREPRHYWSHFWLASTHLVTPDYRAAAQAYDTRVALRPDYALGYAFRGEVLARQAPAADGPKRRQHLEQRAREDFAKAAALEPREPFIHWMHGVALANWKRPAEALRAYARTLDLERPLAAWRGQRVHEDKKKMFTQILTLTDQLLPEKPDDADTLAIRAHARWALGALDDALGDAARSLELRPEHPRALRVRSRVALERGQAEAALADFDRMLAAAPADPDATAGRAAALAVLGRHAEALAGFDRLLAAAEVDWQRVQAHAGRARALARLGRPAEARQAVEAVRQLNTAAAGRLAGELARRD